MNLVELFTWQVDLAPERMAIITQTDSITFAELDRQSNDLAALFQARGLQTGDNVLVLQPFSISLYITLLALFRMGAVAVFPDASAQVRVMADCCRTIPVKGFCGNWKARFLRWWLAPLRAIPLVLPLRPASHASKRIMCDLPGVHPALMTFTSGSTGRPKGIVRSHEFLIKQHQMIVDMLTPKADDVSLISLPVFILSNLASGVTSVIPAGNIRKPALVEAKPLLDQIRAHGINNILMPPALCQKLADTGHPLPQIRKIFTGGGPVFPDLLQGLQHVAPHASITSVYGSTEAEPVAHIALSDVSDADLDDMKAGAGLLVGKPVEGAHTMIIDEEIHVTGHHVIKGYLDSADDKNTKIRINNDIWHRTGDAGRFDDSGRLWLLGRIEARHGNIHPFCIETAARVACQGALTAFLHHRGKNILAVEADADMRQLDLLKNKFGDFEIVKVKAIPVDRRHNSKINYHQLRLILDRVV